MFRNTRIILTSALVKGLVGQFVAWALGYGFIAMLRAFRGLPTPGLYEPAVAFGAILSVIGFLVGAGVLTDWLKLIVGKRTPLRHGAPEGKPEWSRYLNVDYNHKVIGIQYAITSILVLLIGGLFAILFRIELAQPGMQWLTNDQYNTLFSAHGIIMIASILLGVGAMVNYLVPLMIGASDMAFPRLNAFSYWVAIPSAVLILMGMAVGGWDTGWVGYATLSLRAPLGIVLFMLGFWINGFSSIAGSINMLVTTATMRAKGMTLFRMPILVWGAAAASIIQMTATQTVGVALTMSVAERVLGLNFFDPAGGGNPILYQHLFWFYSHPVVYVFVLPGLGVISELLPVFARKPLFGYRWVSHSSASSCGPIICSPLAWPTRYGCHSCSPRCWWLSPRV